MYLRVNVEHCQASYDRWNAVCGESRTYGVDLHENPRGLVRDGPTDAEKVAADVEWLIDYMETDFEEDLNDAVSYPTTPLIPMEGENGSTIEWGYETPASGDVIMDAAWDNDEELSFNNAGSPAVFTATVKSGVVEKVVEFTVSYTGGVFTIVGEVQIPV